MGKVNNNLKNDEWLEKLNQIFEKFDLKPKNYSKYLMALTHSSYSYENGLDYNYERFEFLGDSAISWIITNFLFNNEKVNEGEMSIKKARLVSSQVLSEAAKLIAIDKIILVGNGLQEISNKILENVFESFIGAISDDLGLEKAKVIVDYCIIQRYLNNEIDVSKPYKTKIQEKLMRSNSNEIRYVPIEENNSESKKVKLIFDNKTYGYGEGKTLRIAEENAAKDAYEKLCK